MAFSLTPISESDDSVLAEINVTPLVDVMLVLLIIFMIAAPMLHQGIPVSLPEAQAKALPVTSENPLVLSIKKNGMVYVQETPIHASQLVERLKPILAQRRDQMVYLKADRDLSYGTVINVLNLLHQGGIQRVGMVTEQPPRR